MNCTTFRSLMAVPVLLVLLCVPSVASADGITWTLSGVTLAGGEVLPGAFITFDATTNTVVSANIVTTGCPTCTFTGETYTTQNPGSAPFMPFSIVLVPTGSVSTGTPLLDLELAMPGLTGSVNPVDIEAGVAFEGFCGDAACDFAADSPFRSITGGQLVAPVVTTPEPSTFLLVGMGLLCLVIATKRLVLP
jgi:hypothetical protein